MARCVWALEDEAITEHMCENPARDAKSWLVAMMSSLSREELVRVAVTLWAIWYARRKAIHEQIFQSPLSTHSFVSRFISELNQPTVQRTETMPARGRPPWIPPPSDMQKINVDVTLSKNTGVASVAAIERDATDSFLGASTFVLESISDPETMEALACRAGRGFH
jgi:hypothetical protein